MPISKNYAVSLVTQQVYLLLKTTFLSALEPVGPNLAYCKTRDYATPYDIVGLES